MKTPEEITKLRNALLVAMKVPCECRGTAHKQICVNGRKMLKAVTENLSWALGENDGLQSHVDYMIRRTAEITGSN